MRVPAAAPGRVATAILAAPGPSHRRTGPETSSSTGTVLARRRQVSPAVTPGRRADSRSEPPNVTALLEHPAVQGGVAPFVVALIVAVALGRTRYAWLAIVAGYATQVALSTGFSFTPLSASRKILLLCLLAPLVGMAVDALVERCAPGRLRLGVRRRLAAAWVFLSVLSQREGAQAWLSALGIVAYAAAMVAALVSLRDDGLRTGAAALGLGLATGHRRADLGVDRLPAVGHGGCRVRRRAAALLGGHHQGRRAGPARHADDRRDDRAVRRRRADARADAVVRARRAAAGPARRPPARPRRASTFVRAFVLSLYALAAAIVPIAAAWFSARATVCNATIQPGVRSAQTLRRRCAARPADRRCSRRRTRTRSTRTTRIPNFTVDHLGVSTMYGRFDKSSGKATLDRAAKTGSLDITIETASIATGDNDKGTRARSRDEHLRSADFFNVAEFPRITYKSTKLVFTGDNPIGDRRQLDAARRHQAGQPDDRPLQVHPGARQQQGSLRRQRHRQVQAVRLRDEVRRAERRRRGQRCWSRVRGGEGLTHRAQLQRPGARPAFFFRQLRDERAHAVQQHLDRQRRQHESHQPLERVDDAVAQHRLQASRRDQHDAPSPPSRSTARAPTSSGARGRATPSA